MDKGSWRNLTGLPMTCLKACAGLEIRQLAARNLQFKTEELTSGPSQMVDQLSHLLQRGTGRSHLIGVMLCSPIQSVDWQPAQPGVRSA